MFFFFFRITGGELFERVIDDDFILTERLCELYMMQICEGVCFMHTCNIIHLDMKVRLFQRRKRKTRDRINNDYNIRSPKKCISRSTSKSYFV